MKKNLFNQLDTIKQTGSYRDWMLELEQTIKEFNQRYGTQFDTTDILTEYFNQ